jgi:hypothetical protein
MTDLESFNSKQSEKKDSQYKSVFTTPSESESDDVFENTIKPKIVNKAVSSLIFIL